MVDLAFGTPPEVTRRSGPRKETLEVLEALKERPGEWAVVAEGKSASAGQTWRKRGCLTRTVPDENGRYTIWASYVGEAEADAE